MPLWDDIPFTNILCGKTGSVLNCLLQFLTACNVADVNFVKGGAISMEALMLRFLLILP